MASVQGYSQLQARLHAMGGQGSNLVMKRLGLEVVRDAKLTVPRKTGNLGRSIRLGPVSEKSVTVIAGASYAADVEFGTKAHEITPRAATALRWAASASGRRLSGAPRVGAAVIFAKRVHHPGTHAQPYLMPAALKAVKKTGVDAVVKAWNDAA